MSFVALEDLCLGKKLLMSQFCHEGYLILDLRLQNYDAKSVLQRLFIEFLNTPLQRLQHALSALHAGIYDSILSLEKIKKLQHNSN